MTTGQKIGVALMVLGFILAKVIVLLSPAGGIGIAALGAVLVIVSEPEQAY
jgi:hypothetical protein